MGEPDFSVVRWKAPTVGEVVEVAGDVVKGKKVPGFGVEAAQGVEIGAGWGFSA